ncbi:hypothetical protein LCGC14_1549050 [marine sediment metagenome]|uniref:Uncharacterized protein n=1 Tax=marine sediment metagenome TaxID=412755 RepID=A0A0F9IQV9_9ZZZZ
MKSHIVDEVEGAMRAAWILEERLKAILVALKNMPDDLSRKTYLKFQLGHLDKDVNLTTLRVNGVKEKLVKHDLV